MRKELTDLDQKLSVDFGRHSEFLPLYQKSLSLTAREYTYEMTWFGEFKQKEKGSGRHVSTMGRFDASSWHPSEGGVPVMMFSNGDKCWQGPHRSVAVKLECGASAELIAVDEPGRCEYAATVRSPAACRF